MSYNQLQRIYQGVTAAVEMEDEGEDNESAGIVSTKGTKVAKRKRKQSSTIESEEQTDQGGGISEQGGSRPAKRSKPATFSGQDNPRTQSLGAASGSKVTVSVTRMLGQDSPGWEIISLTRRSPSWLLVPRKARRLLCLRGRAKGAFNPSPLLLMVPIARCRVF